MCVLAGSKCDWQHQRTFVKYIHFLPQVPEEMKDFFSSHSKKLPVVSIIAHNGGTWTKSLLILGRPCALSGFILLQCHSKPTTFVKR